MRDDVAGEAIVVRATADTDLGGARAGEIFTCNTLETVSTLLLERVADIDLVARNPDIHSHLLHPACGSLNKGRGHVPGHRQHAAPVFQRGLTIRSEEHT